MRLIIATCIALVFAASAKAGPATTGNTMLPACKDFAEQRSPGFLNGFCAGLVRGISEMADGETVCSPEGSTNGQEVRVVVSYMEKHPEMLHIDISVLALLALSEAWPCKRKP